MNRTNSTPSLKTFAAAQLAPKGPVQIDPRDFALVSGGLPKGGWGSDLEDAALLPKGGWGAPEQAAVALPKGGW